MLSLKFVPLFVSYKLNKTSLTEGKEKNVMKRSLLTEILFKVRINLFIKRDRCITKANLQN
jgi:hypothetical protein